MPKKGINLPHIYATNRKNIRNKHKVLRPKMRSWWIGGAGWTQREAPNRTPWRCHVVPDRSSSSWFLIKIKKKLFFQKPVAPAMKIRFAVTVSVHLMLLQLKRQRCATLLFGEWTNKRPPFNRAHCVVGKRGRVEVRKIFNILFQIDG